MIDDQMIQLMLQDRGHSHAADEARRFRTFLVAYYREMQKWRVFLSDINYKDLTDNAKDNLFDSALDLWIATKKRG